MTDEVLSSVGAQDMDTSSYQLTDLENIEFNCENSQLDMDAVFRPGIDTPFLQLHLTIYRWSDQLKTPLCWTKNKTENAPPPAPSTPVSVTPREPPMLDKSCFW